MMRLLLVVIGLLPGVLGNVSWDDENCNRNNDRAVRGYFLDAICASDQVGDVCQNSKTKEDCEPLRCLWKDGECNFNRDGANNVCFLPYGTPPVLPEATETCDRLLKGKCPIKMQVPKGCCTDIQSKYDKILKADDGFVCCNTPCKCLEDSYGKQLKLEKVESIVVHNKTFTNADTCSVMEMGSDYCTPRGKSNYGFDPYNSFSQGIMTKDMQMHAFGLYSGNPMSAGVVNPHFASLASLPGGLVGLASMLGGMKEAQGYLEEVPYGSSKNEHVEEITLDDTFEAIIGALDSDKHVFEADMEMTSDPWFGKQKFGGGAKGINLIDPWRFIDQIYGSPMGLGGGFGGPAVPGFGGSQMQPSFGKPYGAPSYGPTAPSYGPATPSYGPTAPSYGPATPSYSSPYGVSPSQCCPCQGPTTPAAYPPSPLPPQPYLEQPQVASPDVKPAAPVYPLPPYDSQQQPSPYPLQQQSSPFPLQQQPSAAFPIQQYSDFSGRQLPATFPSQRIGQQQLPATFPSQQTEQQQQHATFPSQQTGQQQQPATFPSQQTGQQQPATFASQQTGQQQLSATFPSQQTGQQQPATFPSQQTGQQQPATFPSQQPPAPYPPQQPGQQQPAAASPQPATNPWDLEQLQWVTQ